MISPQQGHIDVGLTNVSVMYRNADFVADQILQPLPVQKQSDKYWEYGIDNLRSTLDARRPAAESSQLELTLSPAGPYFCDGHALMDWIPDETLEGVDAPIDPDIDTVTALTDAILLNKEVNTAAAIYAAMTAAGLVTDLSSSSYADAFDNTNTDVIGTIDKAKETVQLSTGKRPNKLLLSRPVFGGIRANTSVRSRITGAPGLDATLITPQMLASIMEVDEVIVADSINVTSKSGQSTVASNYVWQKYALLFYQPKSPGLRTLALGYSFKWMVGRLASLVYRGHSQRRHADWIEVMQYYAQQIIAPAAGLMWTNSTQNW